MKKKSIVFLITSLLLISTINLPAVTPAELNTYFTRFKRGLDCIIKRKPCTAEDKKAVYQAGGTLLGILAIGVGLKLFHAYSPKLGKMFLTQEEKEILNLPSEQQEKAKNERLLEAVMQTNLGNVQRWLSAGANPNAYFGDQDRYIYGGRQVPGHLLNTAIHIFSSHWQNNKPREEAKQIILELLKKGANPQLPSMYRRLGEAGTEQLSVFENHKRYTPYFADTEIREALEKGIAP